MTSFRVDTSKFDAWVNNARRNVRETSLSSLIESGRIIETQASHRVPFEFGYLEKSFRQAIFDTYPKVVLEFGYSVLDNPKSQGFDYALDQHETAYNHPIRGQMYYLKDTITAEKSTIFDLIETDFLSSLNSS